MSSEFKCKHCGMEFNNKGEELTHYKQYKDGSCATLIKEAVEEAVVEKIPERDQTSIPKPDYDKDAEAVDLTSQAGIEAQITAIAREMADRLRERPKEKVVIPEDKLNPQSSFVVVGANGYNIQIKRGVPVMLPDTIVIELENAGYAPTHVR